MSGSESDDNDEQWFLNLQEFVEALQPQLKELEALTQVEEFITNLESTDPSFHRYNFVAQIKDRLDTELSPIIDELLSDKNKKEEDTLAPNISEDLLKSHEFEQSSSSIISAIQSALESITGHLNSNTFDFSGPFQKHDRPNNYFKASSSVCSTTDGMEFMFMPPDRYKSLAKEIDPAKSVEQRLKALGILQQVPQTDLVASDAWELTRLGLHKALNDENEEISCRALKFLSRLFASGSSHVIREYFLLLIENLTDYFLDSTSHMIYLEFGLDLGDRRNILLLKKFRLLNDIQKQLPATWLRYSEKYVEEMIESLVKLLGVSIPKMTSSRDSTIMNPLHFLALVDPHAVWFKQWMHGYYSRSHLVMSISNHTSFLKRPIKSCIEVCKRLHRMEDGPDLEDLHVKKKIDITFESCDILYLHFIHSTNFLSRLMLYKNGRDALFFELNNGKILNIDMVVLALFDIMKLYPFPVHKSPFHGGHLAAECFKLLSNSDEETVQSCLCFDSLYQSVIQAFQQKCTSLPLVIEMLAEIAISSKGCHQLLVERDLAGYDERLPVLEIIGETFIITGHMGDDVNSSTLLPLMTLLQRVFKNFDALILLSKYDVETFLSDLLKKQKAESNVLLEKVKSSMSQGLPSSPLAHPPGSGSGSARKIAENIAYKKSVQIEKQIMETILRLALTPKGMELILQCDVFENCVAYFHHRLLEKGRTAKNGYGIMMSQISSTSKGIEVLLKCGYVDYLLNEIWFYLEGFTNDYTVTALNDIPQDFSDILSQKLFLSLYELVPNVQSVRALFHSSLQQLDQPPELHCFDDFFNRIVLLKLPDTMELYHPDLTHYFALRFLSYLTSSLDVMVFLQAKYDFQRALLDLQRESFYHERDCFILDQNSVQRNQILVQTYLLGGPSERKVPPNTLSEDSTYQWPLFSTYPVPPVYSNKGRTSAFSPDSHLTKLKEFLRKERNLAELSQEEAERLFSELQDMFMMAIKNRFLKEEEETIVLLLELYTKLMKTITNTPQLEKVSKKDREEKSSNKKKMVSDEEEIAISMLVRYGVGLRLLEATPEEHEDMCRKLLISVKNHFPNEHHVFDGFDWFVSVVFLIFKGDEQRTFHFLIDHSSLPPLPTNWLQFRMRNSKQSSQMTRSCHWLEYIIKNELQQVYAAFQISGVSPSQIYRLWLQQCFLNYLDWSDIMTFVTCCIFLGCDYQIYFVISLLNHLKEDIMQQAQENNLLVFLRTTPIQGFRVNDHVGYWEELEEKYRERIFADDF